MVDEIVEQFAFPFGQMLCEQRIKFFILIPGHTVLKYAQHHQESINAQLEHFGQVCPDL